jgi:hypothetical protein
MRGSIPLLFRGLRDKAVYGRFLGSRRRGVTTFVIYPETIRLSFLR